MSLGVATFIVFGGALRFYFAQEDFRGLAVAKGLLPRHADLWRYVSVQGFMDILYPLFGDRPRPYHLVSIGLHATNAIILFCLLARRLAPPVAMVAAMFFVTHPALFTAMYWQSARSDILATTFALIAVVFALRQGRSRWLVVPSLVLAILSKESVLLLPIAIWLILRWVRKSEQEKARPRDWLLPVMGLVSGIYALYLLSGKAGGITVGTARDAAYALDPGLPMLQNLLTYVGWTADVSMQPSELRFVDVRNPDVFGLAIGSMIAWGLAAFLTGLRARGWLVAGATFLLLLTPVLPLANHTYHYFLYAPLTAAAWGLGVGLDYAISLGGARRAKAPKRVKGKQSHGRGQALPWVLAAASAVLLAWNGAVLVKRMETRPMAVYPGLRGDPIIDRSIIAERAVHDLRRVGLQQGTKLAFLFRDRLAVQGRIALGSDEAPAPNEEVYAERNFRTALFDGYGVRAMLPQVAHVTFDLVPPPVSDRTLYAVYAPTGEVEVFSREELDALLKSRWIVQW